jgi:hypothetical protein
MRFDDLYKKYLPESFNRDGYKFYIIVRDKIESGWYDEDQAKSKLEKMPEKLNGRSVIVSKDDIKIDPNDESNWLGGKAISKAEENEDEV